MPKKIAMFDQPVVFVDLETTGGNPLSSRIIEVAAIRLEPSGETKTYQSLVHPGSRIPPFITNITGIDDDDVKYSPAFHVIADELEAFLHGAIFIAHNVRFDYSFLKQEFENCSIDFKPDLCCTVRLSRALYADEKGHSLEKIIARHKIKVDARHRAYADTKAIFEFAKLAYAEHGHDKFHAALNGQKKRKALPPHLDDAQIEAIKNTFGVYIFEDENRRPLYVGKSVKLRTRIMSHFSQDTAEHREMRMSQQIRHIRTIQTDSELEALLLEAELVKSLLPMHNRLLRRKKSIFTLRKTFDKNGYATLAIQAVDTSDFSQMKESYGTFMNKSSAKAFLEEIQEEYQLCPKLLGLEKARHACFSSQLKKCKGACDGREECKIYNLRVEMALAGKQLSDWPHDGPVAIQPKKSKGAKAIVIDQWVVRGYLRAEDDAEPYFEEKTFPFDLDAYKIIKRTMTTDRKKFKVWGVSI